MAALRPRLAGGCARCHMKSLVAAAAPGSWHKQRPAVPRGHLRSPWHWLHSVRCYSTSPVAWLESVEDMGANGSHLPLDQASYDAVLVLAGGLTRDGGLPEWVHRRLDTAYDVQKLQQNRDCPVLCLGGGTPHKPDVLSPSGHVIHESTSCAQYLMDKGMSADTILKEVSSYDTVGNAYFSLVIHAIPAGWRRLAVATSAFHMPRTRTLFCDIYRMAGASIYGNPHWFELTFIAASDEGVFDDYVLQARINKEADSIANWQSARDELQLESLPDFHRWFYADHMCYAVSKQRQFGKRTIKDERLLASY